MSSCLLDALVFPPATYPPKLNGDRNTTPVGTLSGIASALHWPAAVVPMGYSHESLPNGLQLIGRPWSEPILIEIAYAYDAHLVHLRQISGTHTGLIRLQLLHNGIFVRCPCGCGFQQTDFMQRVELAMST